MKIEPCDQCGRPTPVDQLKAWLTNVNLRQIHMLCPECLAKQKQPSTRKRQ